MTSEYGDFVRKGFDEACKRFTKQVAAYGFVRGKKRLWYRLNSYTADLIYFFRSGSSYGAPISAEVDIEAYFSLRVLNSDEDGTHLNGPHSSPEQLRAGRYHLRFNAKSQSMFERCVTDLTRFVVDYGLPWFDSFAEEKSLLNNDLFESKQANLLQQHIEGNPQTSHIARSYKLLGIKQ